MVFNDVDIRYMRGAWRFSVSGESKDQRLQIATKTIVAWSKTRHAYVGRNGFLALSFRERTPKRLWPIVSAYETGITTTHDGYYMSINGNVRDCDHGSHLWIGCLETDLSAEKFSLYPTINKKSPGAIR